jgi:two-component system response regulator (stage 0 sporulation protein F)
MPGSFVGHREEAMKVLSKKRHFVRNSQVLEPRFLIVLGIVSDFDSRAWNLLNRGNMKDPIRVVFVEDDPEMLAIYAENFLLPEFQIGTASNGENAIELLRKTVSRVDVLVTDNHMPKMDGIKLLRTVRQEFPSIKLLMVTGYGNWTDYVDAHDIGVQKFVDKPIKMSELKDLIRGIL